MKVFVLSFGTIELLDGILVVDTDLSYKTFEKEYKEILSKVDKNLKKLLRAAFESEVALKDSKTQENLLKVLDKLEAYDKPSFDFADSFDPQEGETSLAEPLESDLDESEELEAIEFMDEPEILESQENASELESIESPIEPEYELDSADLAEKIEEPKISEIPPKKESPKIKDEPPSEIEPKTKAVTSKFQAQIEEDAIFELNNDQEIKSAKITGKLSLKNLGKNDRIWDINLMLDKTKIKSTSLKENTFHISELSPGKDWELNYEIEKPKDLPLIFKETIDTHLENSELIHNLIPNQKTTVEMTFLLENKEEYEIINLNLEKKIPEEFMNLKVVDEIPPDTSVEYENQVLNWRIPLLKANAKVELTVHANITPTQTVGSGIVQLSATIIDGLNSKLDLENISSISKNMYYIEKDENEEEPDHWKCRFIFDNKSEFPMLLESAEIFSGDISSTQTEVVFDNINEIIRAPVADWRSEEWNVVSEEIPTFGKKVQFKIIPNTSRSLNVKVNIDEIPLSVLWAEVKKSYSTSEVPSYVDTPVEVTTIITNFGEAEISEIRLTDFIPENFLPPSLKDITLLLDGKKIDQNQQKIDITLKREPDSDDSAEPHQLHIQLLNLEKSIGGLKKDSSFEFQYPVMAIKPPPEKVYNFPIKLAITSVSGGPALDIDPSMIENSEITVTHRRRRLTVGKSVFPGAAADEYEILIVFKNRGTTSIEHAIISDLIPPNFKLLSSKPEAELKEDEEKSLLEWKFDAIEPGAELELTYTIEGTGKYKGSDAQIFYKA